jgi:hypothetical protein
VKGEWKENEKEVKNMNKKIVGIVFVFAFIFSVSAVAPTFAVNCNVPEDVVMTYYFGGEGVVEVPANWPPGAVHPTALMIVPQHVVVGTYGCDKDGVLINILYTAPDGSQHWVPVVYFTNNPNPDVLPWLRTVLSGMPVASPTNSKWVSEDVLTVERHWNRITVKLTAPQNVMWSKLGGGYIPVVIPAFTMELCAHVCSIHYSKTITNFVGYAGASGYTSYKYEMVCNAKGVFTCPGWNSEMSDCSVTTHGIVKYVPP